MRALLSVPKYPTQLRMVTGRQTATQTLSSFCLCRLTFDVGVGEALIDWDCGEAKATAFFVSRFLDPFLAIN